MCNDSLSPSFCVSSTKNKTTNESILKQERTKHATHAYHHVKNDSTEHMQQDGEQERRNIIASAMTVCT
jgi:hypothetical protein